MKIYIINYQNCIYTDIDIDFISEMHDFIREELIVLFGSDASDNTTILYGGSCSPKNAEALFRCDNIDGGLIGGAALDGDSFRSIIEVL